MEWIVTLDGRLIPTDKEYATREVSEELIEYLKDCHDSDTEYEYRIK